MMRGLIWLIMAAAVTAASFLLYGAGKALFDPHPNLQWLNIYGDYMDNYDMDYMNPVALDWPVGIIWRGDASLDSVRSWLSETGYGPVSGANKFVRVWEDSEGGEVEWSGSMGNQTGCFDGPDPKAASQGCQSGDRCMRHTRTYADNQYFSNDQWGHYIVATAHYDTNHAGCGSGWERFGWSETVEQIIVNQAEDDGFVVKRGVDGKYMGNAGTGWTDDEQTHYHQSDGYASFISTSGVEGMSLSPDPADLWVCYDSASHECNVWQGEGARFVIENLRNQSGIGLGGYYLYTKALATNLVDLVLWNSSFLGSTGRDVSCQPWQSSDHGTTSLDCTSSGSEPGPLWDGDLAAVVAMPDSGIFYVGNPDHRPTKDNGISVALDNKYCRAKGVDGVPLPGSDGDYTPVCDDASVAVRTLEGDVNLDCVVDVADEQAIALRYGAFWGLQLYDQWYDIEPKDMDWDIDIKDLQFVFGRDGSTCQDPIPCPQSGSPCPQQSVPAEQHVYAFLPDWANMVIDPPSQRILYSGQMFAVDVRVSNVTNPGGLGGYEFTLQFDPNIVSYVGLSTGPFMWSTGAQVQCQGTTGLGTISHGCNTIGSESQRPTGSGQLARLTFQAGAWGVSPLHLTKAVLVAPAGDYITYGVGDGSVSVGFPTAVGGVAEFPQLEAETVATTPGSSGPFSMALVGAVVGGGLLLVASGWYTRRRWQR